MLNPTHLRTLHEVLATGSFAEAATRLGYTASAVSQQIAALERTSGVTLFERDGRSICPTPAASAIAGRARTVLRSLEALERELRAFGANHRGLVRIGSFPTASATILPDAIAGLRRQRPDVTVHLEQAEPDELVRALEAGDLDVAVVHRYERAPRSWNPALAEVPLVTERLHLLLPQGDAPAPGPRSLADLRDAAWIATREDTAAERCLLHLCAEAGFVPRIELRSDDEAVIRGMVRAGLGVALMPAVDGTEVDGLLAVPLPEDAPGRRVLALSRRLAPGSPTMVTIWWLVQAATGMCGAQGLRLERSASVTPIPRAASAT